MNRPTFGIRPGPWKARIRYEDGAEDVRYPIYSISARWEQDGEHDPEFPRWHEGLPEGRIRNSSGLHRMYREDQDLAEIERWARDEWWPDYVATKLADKNPTAPEIEVKLMHRESWCCSWFEHWTFDVGQTDAEALASFERYVRRHEFYQDWPHEVLTDADLKRRGIEYRVCLMGAEDRWRWSGGPGPEDRTAPPCRCEHCTAQGKLRIGH